MKNTALENRVLAFLEENGFYEVVKTEEARKKRILKLLVSGPKTQTELHRATGGRWGSKGMAAALKELQLKGQVNTIKIRSSTRGKPKTLWFLVSMRGRRAKAIASNTNTKQSNGNGRFNTYILGA